MGTYYNISYVLKMFLFPILVFGFITNTISFIVMKRIKSSSTAKYMSFLALVDSGVLLVGGLSLWAHSINYYSSRFISVIGCKLIPFMFYSLADYSVLIIVLMTGERFYGVWKPFKANKNKLKVFRLNLIIGCIFCCLVNSHFIYTHTLVDHNNESESNGVVFISASNSKQQLQQVEYVDTIKSSSSSSTSSNYVCEYAIWKDFYEKYWVFIDASIYSFIPSLLIFSLNILIIRLLNKADKINSNLNPKTKANRTNSMMSCNQSNLIEAEPITEPTFNPNNILRKKSARSASMINSNIKMKTFNKNKPNRHSMVRFLNNTLSLTPLKICFKNT